MTLTEFEGAEQGAETVPSPGRTRITIRIDADVLDWFRQQVHEAGGGKPLLTTFDVAVSPHMAHFAPRGSQSAGPGESAGL